MIKGWRHHRGRRGHRGRVAKLSSARPGVAVLTSYRRSWLRSDLTAGLVLTALLVPQGMAYAELAGLPAVTGLYTSILCLVGYALFGPSKILVLGPDSSLGPMIAATILPLIGADGDPSRAIALASLLALLVGAMTVLAGVAKLGFVADLLSKPTMIGYMNGLALTIVVGQLPKLFGFSVSGDGLVAELRGFAHGIAEGETVGAALAIGLLGLTVILLSQRLFPRVPGVLVAVVVSILASSLLHLSEHGVQLVGSLPKGLPHLTIPNVSFSDLGLLVAGAFGIALVSLADTISTASSFATRAGGEIDGNRDDRHRRRQSRRRPIPGLSRLHQRFTNRRRGTGGSEDPDHGLVGALAITLMLLFVPGLLRNLPQPTLAAVVIAAALSLADFEGSLLLWRRRRSEFILSITVFLGVALLGVLAGIGLAVVLSVTNVFRRLWWPYQTRLGRVQDVAGYHDISRYPEAEQLTGCVIFRFDAPLFFANARSFRERIRAIARSEPPPLWIVVAAEPITDVDTTASDMLEELDASLNAKGISLVFAELKDPVRDKIDRYGLPSVCHHQPYRFGWWSGSLHTAFGHRHGHKLSGPRGENNRYGHRRQTAIKREYVTTTTGHGKDGQPQEPAQVTAFMN